ncbi:MAG: hypothetical protein NTX50_27795 [Candidatus Sumerlaeota bacterium]|nr:hypothetical protein [Candidatus Sumerlaeota bacterium]
MPRYDQSKPDGGERLASESEKRNIDFSHYFSHPNLSQPQGSAGQQQFALEGAGAPIRVSPAETKPSEPARPVEQPDHELPFVQPGSGKPAQPPQPPQPVAQPLAEQAAQQIQQPSQENLERFNRELAGNYYNQGYKAYKQNKLEEAQEYLSNAVKLSAETEDFNREARNLLGNIKAARGEGGGKGASREERAKVASIQRAVQGGNVELQTQQSEQINLGLQMIEQGREQEGAQFLRQAEQLGAQLSQRGQSRQQEAQKKQYAGQLAQVQAKEEQNRKLREEFAKLQEKSQKIVLGREDPRKAAGDGVQAAGEAQLFIKNLSKVAQTEGVLSDTDADVVKGIVFETRDEDRATNQPQGGGQSQRQLGRQSMPLPQSRRSGGGGGAGGREGQLNAFFAPVQAPSLEIENIELEKKVKALSSALEETKKEIASLPAQQSIPASELRTKSERPVPALSSRNSFGPKFDYIPDVIIRERPTAPTGVDSNNAALEFMAAGAGKPAPSAPPSPSTLSTPSTIKPPADHPAIPTLPGANTYSGGSVVNAGDISRGFGGGIGGVSGRVPASVADDRKMRMDVNFRDLGPKEFPLLSGDSTAFGLFPATDKAIRDWQAKGSPTHAETDALPANLRPDASGDTRIRSVDDFVPFPTNTTGAHPLYMNGRAGARPAGGIVSGPVDSFSVGGDRDHAVVGGVADRSRADHGAGESKTSPVSGDFSLHVRFISLDDKMLQQVKQLMYENKLQAMLWPPNGTPSIPGEEIRLDERTARLIATDNRANLDRLEELIKGMASTEPLSLVTKIIRIRPEDGPKIKALLEAQLYGDEKVSARSGRKIIAQGEDMIVRDYPAKVQEAEQLLKGGSFITAITDQNIEIGKWNLTPRMVAQKDPEALKAYFDNVVDVIETQLYSQEGKDVAASKGRRIWYDPVTLSITITDTPDKLKEVGRYIDQLSVVEKTGGQKAFMIKNVKPSEVSDGINQMKGAGGTGAAGGRAGDMWRTTLNTNSRQPTDWANHDFRIQLIRLDAASPQDLRGKFIVRTDVDSYDRQIEIYRTEYFQGANGEYAVTFTQGNSSGPQQGTARIEVQYSPVATAAAAAPPAVTAPMKPEDDYDVVPIDDRNLLIINYRNLAALAKATDLLKQVDQPESLKPQAKFAAAAAQQALVEETKQSREARERIRQTEEKAKAVVSQLDFSSQGYVTADDVLATFDDISAEKEITDLEKYAAAYDNVYRDAIQSGTGATVEMRRLRETLAAGKKKIAEVRENRKKAKEVVVGDLSDIAQQMTGNDVRMLETFFNRNYSYAITTQPLTQWNDSWGRNVSGNNAVQFTNGTAVALNWDSNADVLNEALVNFRANEGRVVSVAGMNLNGGALRGTGLLTPLFTAQTANGRKYAVLDEAQYQTLAQAAQQTDAFDLPAPEGVPIGRQDKREVIVGTPNTVVGQQFRLGQSAAFSNGLIVDGTQIELPNNRYLAVDNGGYITILKAGAVREWQEKDAAPVTLVAPEPPLPEAIFPAVGVAYRFEKTFLTAGESPDIILSYEYSKQGN